MSNNPFAPWWYYEMGRMSAEHSSSPRKKPTASQKVGKWVVLAMFWIITTPALAIMLWVIATIFGGLDFWLCLVICGLLSFWLCSLMAH